MSGQRELGDIATIIKRADQRSTSKALGAQQTPTFSSEKPLFLKIKSALRILIADGKISLNRKGANGWIAHDHVWILAKIAVDKVREQLEVEGHSGVPSDNSRMFDIMMDHALIQNNPEGNKAIWKITVETLDWKPTNEFSVLKIPLNIAYASNDYCVFDGMINVIERNYENNSSTIEEYVLDPYAEQQASTYNNEQTDVTKTPKECGPPFVESKKTDPLIDGSDPVIIRQNPGTDFFFWVKESLTNPSISKNTATSLIHNTKAGLLLVSPLIFKEYCEQHSLKNWSAVQKSFQALRLNLKTPGKGENTFKVRVSGKRKISTLQCWIIPHSELDGCSLPNINSHLDVLNIEN